MERVGGFSPPVRPPVFALAFGCDGTNGSAYSTRIIALFSKHIADCGVQLILSKREIPVRVVQVLMPQSLA